MDLIATLWAPYTFFLSIDDNHHMVTSANLMTRGDPQGVSLCKVKNKRRRIRTS
jgi:hypothetical protein